MHGQRNIKSLVLVANRSAVPLWFGINVFLWTLRLYSVETRDIDLPRVPGSLVAGRYITTFGTTFASVFP